MGLSRSSLGNARLRAGAIALVCSQAACNMVTGGDFVEFTDDAADPQTSEDDSGTTGQGSFVGAGGSTGMSVGAGGDANPATTSVASTTGAGGAVSATSASSSVSSGTGGGGAADCGGSGPGTTPLDSEELDFLDIINAYRADNGLGALAACTSLNRTAQGHSEDMRDHDYFDHTGLNGSTPWDRACDACFDLGCGPNTAMAENIAAGNSGAMETFIQWKNSPGHNANMLTADFTMIGIGRGTGGGTYGVYWTNVFAGDDEASCY